MVRLGNEAVAGQDPSNSGAHADTPRDTNHPLAPMPRQTQVTAAIVTCGGLCPGLNDVVQNIVFTLTGVYFSPAAFEPQPQRWLAHSLTHVTHSHACDLCHTLNQLQQTMACLRTRSWAFATACVGFTSATTSQ